MNVLSNYWTVEGSINARFIFWSTLI